MNDMNGLILLRKPQGITSFHALDEIKKKLKIKKVGHTGTLDKFAEGLLVVLTGTYTRLTPLFSHLDKEYISTIELGKQTDTLDPEGEIVNTGEIPEPETITGILSQFSGEMEQIPPRYSAIHLNGERLYKKALRGEDIHVPKRKIVIHKMKQLLYNPPYLQLKINCSGGTYIRAIARDIGKESGSCAYVTELIRTKVGRFELSSAVTASQFEPEKDFLPPHIFISQLCNVKIVHIKKEYSFKVVHGIPLRDDFFLEKTGTDGIYAVFEENTLRACIKKTGNNFTYMMVFGGK
ncbi:MAG: tRNA pseudouridine(55) synthase TruB [Spirochaetales bacterium]|nr:tRNA pseudouridine(55) synthase TruB [Spirochaetales bacterium]